jgi:hypothetical protein
MNIIKNYYVMNGPLHGQLMSLWDDEMIVQFLDPAGEKEYQEKSMNSAPEDFTPWRLLTYKVKGDGLVLVLDGLN